ncbi:DJ-1/PfpI family protein [Candidatus Gracilibacteria bacterium]|nr:DJ-1/PfpI family protein [Candidatus Gracilibacteria bacterium]MCF7819802.1 DJ-1/PfpI family protein [Candidatus Gracilibacteria bacterium]
MKRILMVLAPKDFRDSEYIVPRAFWEQNGADVMTCSTEFQSTGKYGYKVTHDFEINEVCAGDFDALFFVGGGGSLELVDNEELKELTENFQQSKKVIGALCAAPRNLLQWGILKGKKCTGYNGDGKLPDLCKKYGAQFVDQSTVTDGQYVTGTGPHSAEETALALLDVLS